MLSRSSSLKKVVTDVAKTVAKAATTQTSSTSQPVSPSASSARDTQALGLPTGDKPTRPTSSTMGPQGSKLPGAQQQRSFMSFGSPAPNPNMDLVKKFISEDYANGFISKAQASGELQAKDASNPPSKEGLMAIVGYTAGPVYNQIVKAREIRAAGGPDTKYPNQVEDCRLADALEALIGHTLGLIQPEPVKELRRNKAVSKETLDAHFNIGQTITLGTVEGFPDKLTSATKSDQQAYTGGNADFVVIQKDGTAVSVSSLSQFKRENEGLMTFAGTYQVVGRTAGRENGTSANLGEDRPDVTITLKEV